MEEKIKKYEEDLKRIEAEHLKNKGEYSELGYVINVNEGIIKAYRYFIQELKSLEKDDGNGD